MRKSKKIQPAWLIFVLILPVLACAIGPQAEPTVPAPPSGVIEPDPQAVERTKENLNQSLQEASQNYEARFRITNEEITSVVAEGLAQRADIPFSQPQIWFTAGKIYISGEIEALGGTFPALIVALPNVSDDGQLTVTIDEAKMGNFDIPESMVDSLTQTTNETLADFQLDMQITGIEVLEGEMIIAGKRIEP